MYSAVSPWLKAVVFLLILPLLSACSSSTMINSAPRDAKVYINGTYMGRTPYSHRDSKIIGTTTEVRLEKEGYEPTQVNLVRDEELQVGPLIAGIFFLVPFLWVMGYQGGHTYEMEPATNTGAMPAPQQAQPVVVPVQASGAAPQPQ